MKDQMMNENHMSRGAKLALFLLAGIVAVSVPASAAVKSNCTVSRVKFSGTPTPYQAFVTCGGDEFRVTSGNPGWTCQAVSKEAVEAYVSFFQAALLSGRAVDIDYTSGCSSKLINNVVQR